MGKFLNPDNQAFQNVPNSSIYVDKTELLDYVNSVINTTSKFICNSRPRRFGKSITADMLTAYYSKGCNSEEMFSHLKIAEKESFRKNRRLHQPPHSGRTETRISIVHPGNHVDRIWCNVLCLHGSRKEIYRDHRRVGCTDPR